jgi:hypothetical protein
MSYATAAHKQLADTLGVPVAVAPVAIEQQPTDTSTADDSSSDKKGKARSSQVCATHSN